MAWFGDWFGQWFGEFFGADGGNVTAGVNKQTLTLTQHAVGVTTASDSATGRFAGGVAVSVGAKVQANIQRVRLRAGAVSVESRVHVRADVSRPVLRLKPQTSEAAGAVSVTAGVAVQRTRSRAGSVAVVAEQFATVPASRGQCKFKLHKCQVDARVSRSKQNDEEAIALVLLALLD